ncbi:rab GTPase-activating protein 1-like isoform X1 [Tachysurus ichikawai]
MICASDLCDFCLDDCGMVGGARQDSPQEGVITRDIHRTFPAHDYFKDSDGDGQDSLYKICKAYSVYDEEIGYCQGQSFLAAVLLLHMPEEQAFCVLVKIMYDYKLRNLYRNNFEDLHCKFYQLERLIQEQLPDLWTHFQDLNLEAHMYASQWFLTLFTAKFPLCMVFHITDLLLCEGLNIIFNVALALLKRLLDSSSLAGIVARPRSHWFRGAKVHSSQHQGHPMLWTRPASSCKLPLNEAF